MTETHPQGRTRHQVVGLFLGPALCLLMMLSAPPTDLSAAGWMTASVGILMAVWWATEAVPISVTALLPIVLFPLLDVATIQDSTSPYANKVVFLFLDPLRIERRRPATDLHGLGRADFFPLAIGNRDDDRQRPLVRLA